LALFILYRGVSTRRATDRTLDGALFFRIVSVVVVIVIVIVADGYGGRGCRYAGFHDGFS